MSQGAFMKEDEDHSQCKWSSGIHEGLTVGQGKLDKFGYWERPCYFCARKAEEKDPKNGYIWPFSREYLKKSNEAINGQGFEGSR